MSLPMAKGGGLPTHRFRVLDKTTDQKNEIGAAWLNTDGSLTVVLNICTILQSDKNLVYTLFPIERK